MDDIGFTRPTLQDLIDRAQAEINTRLPGADSRVRRSVLGVLARIAAGAAHGLYGLLDFIARQALYDQASGGFLPRWASIWGITRKPAAAATGSVDVTGTDGVKVPAGTLLQRADGAEFAVTASTTVAGGTASVPVKAVATGAESDAPAATALALTTPIAGIAAAVVDAGGLTGGVDVETDDSLRARFLDRIRQPPHGGAGFDYVKWALEVPGVTRAWVTKNVTGPGSVGVQFVMDDKAGTIIPDAAEVAVAQAYIDSPSRRPVTADVFVTAPIPVTLDLTITLDPDTTDNRIAVEAEVQDAILRDAAPGGTIHVSRLREAISIAPGEHHHQLAAPAADIIHNAGEMAIPGVITWS